MRFFQVWWNNLDPVIIEIVIQVLPVFGPKKKWLHDHYLLLICLSLKGYVRFSVFVVQRSNCVYFGYLLTTEGFLWRLYRAILVIMASPADDPNVTLTIRLIMQGKVSWTNFWLSFFWSSRQFGNWIDYVNLITLYLVFFTGIVN